MIFIELGIITLKITDTVLKRMLLFKQDTINKKESGGVLIGYYIDQNYFSVLDVTTPTSYDKSSRNNFTRRKESVQKSINELFKQSGGKKIYLGEWHTHPEKKPIPSGLDKRSILEQIKLNRLNSNIIFMIIIGTEGIHISSVKKENIIASNLILYNDLIHIND